jgi:hypothetical protein
MPEQNGSFQALPSLTAEVERRGAERYPSDAQPSWRLLGRRTGESRVAKVHDISLTGISLRLKHWVKPGTVLVIRLQVKEGRLSRPLSVRVMHATQQPDDDWQIGCMFIRTLSSEELRALVSDPV